MNLINKFFLVKEIVSRQGELHFQRYRLLQTPWFAIYIHRISKSDMDKDMHDHPWRFISLILKGSYSEACKYYPDFKTIIKNTYTPGCLVTHQAEDAHQLTLLTDVVWTLVVTSGRSRLWGYQTSSGWIDHQTYRKLKNELRA